MGSVPTLKANGGISGGWNDSVIDLTGAMGNRDINATRSDAFYNNLTANNADGSAAMSNPFGWYNAQSGNLAKGATFGTTGGTALDSLKNSLTTALGQTATQRYGDFTAVNPNLIGQAQAATQAAMSPMFSYDPVTEKMSGTYVDLAQRGSYNLRRAMEQRLAQGGMLGTDSGAGRSALMQATLTPWTDMMSKLGETQANTFQSIYNPQAQATMSSIYNNPTTISNAMGAIAGSYGTLGDLFNSLGGTQGNTGNNLLGALGQQSEQQLIAPQFQTQAGLGTQLGNAATQLGAAYLGK